MKQLSMNNYRNWENRGAEQTIIIALLVQTQRRQRIYSTYKSWCTWSWPH